MKTQLTKEQSDHLMSFGIKFPYKFAIHNGKMAIGPFKDEYPDPNGWYIPILITDLLEILPKEIDHSKFYMIGNGEEWEVGYCHYNGEELYPASDLDFKAFRHNLELVEALYELCVWLIKNKYLKFK